MKTIFRNASKVAKILPKRKGVALVGGCFDLIHVGHLHLLEYAASLEDLLVVAVLSDQYVRQYKGLNRPTINEKDRARMVASIRCVDFVYISDISPSNPETLLHIKPRSVVFGREGLNSERMKQRIKNIRDHLPHSRIKFLPRYRNGEVSTGSIIASIKNCGG